MLKIERKILPAKITRFLLVGDKIVPAPDLPSAKLSTATIEFEDCNDREYLGYADRDGSYYLVKRSEVVRAAWTRCADGSLAAAGSRAGTIAGTPGAGRRVCE